MEDKVTTDQKNPTIEIDISKSLCYDSKRYPFLVEQLHFDTHVENARLKDPWTNNGLNVDQMMHFDRSVMAHEIIDKQCPESLWGKYTQRNEISRYYNTRCNRNLDIQKFKLECTKKGFHLTGLKAWN